MKTFLLFTLLFPFGLQASEDNLSASLKNGSQKKPAVRNISLKSESLESLTIKAEASDVLAQRELGYRYLEGRDGAPQDNKKAFHWLHRAAVQGDAMSQDQVGEMYFSGKGVDQSEEKAIVWLTEAARQNYKKAQETLRALSVLNLDVRSSRRDLVESYKWASLTYARNVQGEMLSEVDVIFLNYLENQMSPFQIVEAQGQALQVFRKEVEKEKIEEQRKIQIHQKESSIGQDVQIELFPQFFQQHVTGNMRSYEIQSTEDLRYLEQNARAGDANAQHALGNLYLSIEVQDLARAIFWHRKAAQQGHVESQYILGVLSATGNGLPKNYEEANIWFKKAAYQGHVKAAYHLANSYLMELGMDPNYGKAIFWLERSAEENYGPAQYRLALIYSSGEGVPRNYMEAYKWAVLVHAQGSFIQEASAILDFLETELPLSKVKEVQQEATRFHRAITKNLEEDIECY